MESPGREDGGGSPPKRADSGPDGPIEFGVEVGGRRDERCSGPGGALEDGEEQFFSG